MVFYVYVQHALIQMTLNISFLFWLNKQTNGSSTTIVYHYENMTVKFIFVWSTGRSGERMNGKKEKESNECGENARKITDFGGSTKKHHRTDFYATNFK